MYGMAPVDLAAPLWLLALWVGYTLLARSEAFGRGSLMARMHDYRRLWMERMLTRDNRMLDIQVVALWSRSAAFFASTSMLILAGLLAVLGAREQGVAVLAPLPLVTPPEPLLWTLEVLLLLVIFAYAFFKFTWAMRQYNYVAVIVGAAPVVEVPDEAARRFAERGARIASRAAEHSNLGIRAYYFGLAALCWFLHPLLLAAAAIWVVLVLYRREFRSHIVHTLGTPDLPLLP
jgi:uncharacterized membrane protein